VERQSPFGADEYPPATRPAATKAARQRLTAALAELNPAGGKTDTTAGAPTKAKNKKNREE
jgi:hypothetical protein